MKPLFANPLSFRIGLACLVLIVMFVLMTQAKGFADSGKAPPSDTGVVTAGSDQPAIPVYQKPERTSAKMGTLKNGAQVTVTAVQNHWAAVTDQNKTVYVPLQSIRFYKTFSQDVAKKIVDEAITAQRQTWKKAYTKKEIEALMDERFTTAYTNQYFNQLFRQRGKKADGTPLYHILETEISGYAIDSFDWVAKSDPQKPTVTYYVQDGVEYLKVAQYHLNEESGNHMSTLYLFKQPNQPNWKVYDYITVY